MWFLDLPYFFAPTLNIFWPFQGKKMSKKRHSFRCWHVFFGKCFNKIFPLPTLFCFHCIYPLSVVLHVCKIPNGRKKTAIMTKRPVHRVFFFKRCRWIGKQGRHCLDSSARSALFAQTYLFEIFRSLQLDSSSSHVNCKCLFLMVFER